MNKTNAIRQLDTNNIKYEVFEYPTSGALDAVSVAGYLNENPEQVFKTLVTVGASKTNYVFVVPGNNELDLKKAAKAVNEKSIEMIPQKTLLPLTGYIHGGCSPIGMKKLFKTTIDETEGKLKDYPEYGAKYANIKIEKIDVDLPVFFGDDLDILKNGVGHSTGSYFPGEGGSIIYMGHNSEDVFRRFSELNIGDKIEIITSYGVFEYEIYNYKIINETDLEELPIQKEKEILMIYTCYPLHNIGYAYQRYVVYANLIK